MMILITRKNTFTPRFDDMKYLMDKKIYSFYLLAYLLSVFGSSIDNRARDLISRLLHKIYNCYAKLTLGQKTSSKMRQKYPIHRKPLTTIRRMK